jgi:putative toxin-antitoxin system antitoxin component (TIGR02293 family)
MPKDATLRSRRRPAAGPTDPAANAAAPSAFEVREERVYDRSARFLGGKRLLGGRVASRSDVHAAAVGGMPYGSLMHLVGQLEGIDEEDIAGVLGVSTRTLRRQAAAPGRPMPVDVASKAWLLAETVARATEVFGGLAEAERWLAEPALGLDGQRPIDLLRTLQGAELVGDFLGRLEYGVYA